MHVNPLNPDESFMVQKKVIFPPSSVFKGVIWHHWHRDCFSPISPPPPPPPPTKKKAKKDEEWKGRTENTNKKVNTKKRIKKKAWGGD